VVQRRLSLSFQKQVRVSARVFLTSLGGPEGDDHPQSAIHSYIVWGSMDCGVEGGSGIFGFLTITVNDNIFKKFSLNFFLLVDKKLENVCMND
jgi:hypothetical protein